MEGRVDLRQRATENDLCAVVGATVNAHATPRGKRDPAVADRQGNGLIIAIDIADADAGNHQRRVFGG
ncbi:MAG: hypothetical protein AW10_00311 [Candidatus Accumulibacter appositus]|uniref:Uncharacterized protein n=1 Tax=Candidatus Accumulibacter appositus TaxID=1454003 RepID=A0A011P5K0_9PROT|nr:MAG: hypothetical protein AW10_00311 [Candidatus Accumulibacter appositus]